VLAGKRQALGQVLTRGIGIVLEVSQPARTHEGCYTRSRRAGVLAQGSRQPATALVHVAPDLPEGAQRAAQPQTQLRVALRRLAPLQGGAQVVVLRLQTVQPRDLVGPTEAPCCCFGHLQVIASVPGSQGGQLAGERQALQPVLANRLQHREAWHAVRAVRPPEQVLGQQRAHPFQGLVGRELRSSTQVGRTDRFHGLQRTAAHEDGQAAEQRLLLCIEQVVTPGNGAA
jgi:hypothetical protein